MELKILKIQDTELKQKTLTEISGYCILNLIVSKLSNNNIIDDNSIVNYEFFEYDYDKQNTRLTNNQYIEISEKFIKNLE